MSTTFFGVIINTRADDGSERLMEVRQILPCDSVSLMAFGNGNLGAILPGSNEPAQIHDVKVFSDLNLAVQWMQNVTKLSPGPLNTALDNAAKGL